MTEAGEGAAPSDAAAGAEDAEFRLLADHAPVMIWRAGRDRGCDFLNRPWLEFTGRTLDQERGFGWATGVHPEDFDRCLATYNAAFDARRPFTMDYRLRRQDGAFRWVLDNGRPYARDGDFAGFFGSCIDITEMKQALDDRRQALADRETLLAELLHRVKNNAQATTSLLTLQASRAADAAVARALRGAATRVMLASRVQDRMFRMARAGGVDLGAEILAAARMAFDIAGRPGIAFEDRIAATLIMPVAQATPLALIVNELVVNALRHGFPAGRAGHVRLLAQRIAPGAGEVVVEDDGIGLEARAMPRDGLGLSLAARLARQARATLRFDAAAGTRAVLRFATR